MAQFCVYCGAPVSDAGDYCPACGKSRRAASDNPGSDAKPIILPPEAEKTFFQDGTVTVTSTRFVVPGRVFPMSEVRGARVERTESVGSLPSVLYVLALGAFLARLYRFGFLLLIVGALARLFFKPKFTVVLDSLSGEVRAFSRADQGYILEILDALQKALLYR